MFVRFERRSAAFERRRFDVCSIVTSEFYRQKNYGTSNSILTEFLAIVGDDTTEQSFKHAASGLIINTAVQYVDLNTRFPAKLRIALSISNEEQDAFDAAGKAEAGTNYSRNWGTLYVTKQVTVGDVEYTFTLRCSDGSIKKRR